MTSPTGFVEYCSQAFGFISSWFLEPKVTICGQEVALERTNFATNGQSFEAKERKSFT